MDSELKEIQEDIWFRILISEKILVMGIDMGRTGVKNLGLVCVSAVVIPC